MTTETVALKLSGDRKVSPTMRVKRDGKTADIKVYNTFGLPAGVTCPGMTAACETVCYARRTENTYRSAGALVRHNYETLVAHGDDVAGLAKELHSVVAVWRLQAAKHAAPLVFRIHWDGDFYSLAYAEAWRDVMARFPEVQFWAYTRSFVEACDVTPILADVPNLALYLSVDEHNAARAAVVLAQYPRLKAATLGETSDDAAVILAQLGRSNAPKCPENVKRLPLMVAQSGKRTEAVQPGDTAQGACVACGLCVEGRADVRFATKKR